MTSSGDKIKRWNDRSGNNSHAIQNSLIDRPSYLASHVGFNNKACVDFDLTDYLTAVPTATWTSAYSLFMVLYSDATTPQTLEAFFSNNDVANVDGAMQIDYGNNSFRWRANNNVNELSINFGAFKSKQLKLYGVVHYGSKVVLLEDGKRIDSVNTTKGRGFVKYKINQNRISTACHNSKIAEVILYNRALSYCELETMFDYLGPKYGKSFNSVVSGYDYSTNCPEDITSIGKYPTTCSSGIIDSAKSSICSFYSPLSNNTVNEYAIIGHNGADLNSVNTTTPAGVGAQLARMWRFDEDGTLGSVNYAFDISTLGFNLPTTTFYLVESSTSNFSSGSIVSSQYTMLESGSIVKFESINLTDGNYFTLGYTSSLPIKILNFNGKEDERKQIQLTWNTNNEINNKGFFMERSYNGIDFKNIGFVESKHNNNTQYYSFNDAEPTIGHNYYRIKQVDLDNTFSFSSVIEVKVDNTESIEIHPNPVEDFILFKNIKNREGAIIMDLLGRVYYKFNEIPDRLDTSTLPTGLYIIALDGKSYKFLKK